MREASCSCRQLRQVTVTGAATEWTRAVPAGAFADPDFPPPAFSVWEDRKHAWVTLPDGVERMD